MEEADDSYLEKQAEELTSCVICTNRYFYEDDEGKERVPKVLDCMHTFCAQCISQHLEALNSQRLSPVSNFPCPTCRKTCYVPNKGINAFHTDMRVKQINAFINGMKSAKVGPSAVVENMCKVCHFKGMKVKGTFLCLKCQKVFCKTCRDAHSKTSIFTDHPFFNLTDGDKSRRDSKAQLQCAVHSSDHEYFCQTCKKILCCICTMMPEHKNHHLVSLNSKTEKRKLETVSESNSPIEGPEQSNLNSSLLSSLPVLRHHVEEATNSIKDYEDMLKNIKECEMAAEKAYEEAKKMLKEEHQKNLSNIKTRKTNLEKIYSNDLKSTIILAKKLDSKVTKNPNLNSDSNSKKINDFIETMVKSLDKFHSVPKENFNCCFEKDIKIQLGDVKSMSFVRQAAASSPDIEVASISSSTSEQPVESHPSQNIRKDALLKTLLCRSMPKRNKPAEVTKPSETTKPSAATKTSDTMKQTLYQFKNDMLQGLLHWEDNLLISRNLCFADSGKVVVVVDERATTVASQLKVFSSSEGYEINVIFETIVEPIEKILNVCYQQDTKHLHVLCRDKEVAWLKKFKVEAKKTNQPIRTKCLETTKLASLVKPKAVAVKKGCCAILEDDGPRITVFNSKFQKVASVSHEDFENTSYLLIDNSNRIVFSDYPSHEIKVFKDGVLVLKFSLVGSDESTMSPQGLAVDQNNNFLVADHAQNNVSLYSEDGSFLDTIIEYIPSPWGIAFSQDKHMLAVATEKGIKLYKL